jgi:fibronectin-binding autotransporter adhesin
MIMTTWLSAFQKLVSGNSDKQRKRRRLDRSVHLSAEILEDRSLLSGFSESLNTLGINLASNESVQVSSNGSSYTFELDAGGTWTGTNSANVTGNGTSTLTVTAAGVSTLTTINVADVGSGSNVTFVDSGSNDYAANFSVVLDDAAAGTISFTGASTFNNAWLSATTTRDIVVNSGAAVTALNGNLTLSANRQALPTAGNFVGVLVDGGLLESTGTGLMTISGTGGTSAGFQVGVEVTGGGTVATDSSNIVITGTGGTAVSSDNDGILLTADSHLTTLGGSVLLTGTAGSGASVGIVVTGAGAGPIDLTVHGGNVSLTADRMDLSAGGIATNPGGTVTLAPITASTAIDLGSMTDSAANTLELSDDELDRIATGTLQIGSGSSGSIGISAPITRPALTNVLLTSNAAINFAAGPFNSLNTDGGKLLITPGTAGIGVANSGVDATVGTTAGTALAFAAGANLNVNIAGNIADSGYQQLQAVGSVNLAGLNLVLGGGYTPAVSDNFVIVDNDGTDPILGTFNGLAEGALVSVNGVMKKLTYVGGDGNDVELQGLTLSASLSGGALTISDFDPVGVNNNLTVTRSGSDLVITAAYEQFGAAPAGGMLSNGNKTLTIPSASITSGLFFNTGGGDDMLTLDLTGGSVFPTGGISFDGGSQATTAGDRLSIVGGNQGTVTYNYSNANDGSIVMSSYGTVNYIGLEPITNSGTATDVIFNLTAGADQAEIVDDGHVANGIARLVSNNGSFEQTDFALPSGSLTINTGGGADAVTLTNVDGLAASLTINGNTGTADVMGSAALSLGAGHNLTINTVGDVNLTGAIVVPGTTSISTGTGGITLISPANNFTGAVTLSNSGSADVAVTDVNAIVLGPVTVGSGVLTITGMGIAQSASIVQAAGAGAATFNGGTGAISLTSTSNDFTGSVSLNSSGTNAAAVTDTNDIVLGTSNVGSGTLTVTATGITQTGHVVQEASAGAATFNAGPAAITLTDPSNDFTGSVTLNNSGTNDVQVTDATAIVLGNVNVGTGALTVNAVGISQSLAIIQSAGAGAATFNGGAGPINLSVSSNDFTGVVMLNNTGANDATIADSNAITFGTSALGHNLTVVAGGIITQTGPISGGTLSISAVGGANLATSINAITGFSASNVTSGNILLSNLGMLTLTGGNIVNNAASGTITINNTGDLSSTGSVTSNNGTILIAAIGASDLTIGGIVSSGTNANITLRADEAVTLSANVTTLGSGTLIVGGNSITNATNILVNNNSVISTVDGLLRFRANASVSPSTVLDGIVIDSATIATSGLGAINMISTGGSTSGTGIVIKNSSIVRSTSSAAGAGAILLNGTGGTGAGAINHGVDIEGDAVVKSTGTASITILGTGGGIAGSTANDGVILGSATAGGSIQTTSTGTIQVTGIAGFGGPASGSFGIQLIDHANVSILTNTTSLQLVADSMDIGTTLPVIGTTTSRVSLFTNQDGTNIELGGSDVTGTLGLTDAELDRIQATTLTIDARSSGVISTSTNITRGSATSLTLGGKQINLVAGSIDTNGGSLLISSAEGVRFSNTGTDVTGSLSFASRAVGRFSSSGNGSVLNVNIGGTTVDTTYQQYNVVGTIDITGTDLQLDGAYIPTAGNVFTIVSATNIVGTFNGLPEGATRGFNNRDLQIHYTANTITLTDVNSATSPNVTADNASLSANELNPSILQNSGVFSDPQGASTVTLSVNFGTIIQNTTTGIWTWSIDSSDGLSLGTVLVTATDADGHTSTTTFNYTVLNVAPTIALSGNASVNEGSPYTLHFDSITDPGIDTVTAYSINWGDGVTSNFTSNPITNGSRNHTYADGPNIYTIQVTLTDEDGTFANAGSKSVTVNNVAPTIIARSKSSATFILT